MDAVESGHCMSFPLHSSLVVQFITSLKEQLDTFRVSFFAGHEEPDASVPLLIGINLQKHRRLSFKVNVFVRVGPNGNAWSHGAPSPAPLYNIGWV